MTTCKFCGELTENVYKKVYMCEECQEGYFEELRNNPEWHYMLTVVEEPDTDEYAYERQAERDAGII